MTLPVSHQSTVMYANYFSHTRPHSADYQNGLGFYLFRLQAEGTCRALVEGKVETVIPGDLLLYSPGQSYGLNVQPRRGKGSGEVQPVSDYFLIGNGEWLDSWWSRAGLPGKINIGFDDTVITLWKHIIHEKKREMRHQAETMDYLLRAFCLTLERAAEAGKRTGGEETARKLKRFIENHACEPLRLETISASAGLSVSRCSSLFKAAYGQSLFAYCIDVRLKLAEQQVLYSGLALEQVAEKTGFQSYPHFCRVFRARFGLPPGEYRRKLGYPFHPC